MTLHATLQEGAKAFPDRCWLRFETRSWSYAEGDALTDKIAARAGRPGRQARRPRRPALRQFARAGVLLLRLFQGRRVAVPLNTRFQVAELVYALNHSARKS